MNLTEQEKYRLTYLARKSLESEFQDEPIRLEVPEKNLMQRKGAFVFLKNSKGELRGVSGYIMPEMPLWKTVVQATKLATRDQRYLPIQQQELSEIKISIVLIDELKPLTSDVSGDVGILIRYGPLQGLTFPQEIEERGWTMEEAVLETLKKARLPLDAKNSKECKIDIFTCETLQENKTYLKYQL